MHQDQLICDPEREGSHFNGGRDILQKCSTAQGAASSGYDMHGDLSRVQVHSCPSASAATVALVNSQLDGSASGPAQKKDYDATCEDAAKKCSAECLNIHENMPSRSTDHQINITAPKCSGSVPNATVGAPSAQMQQTQAVSFTLTTSPRVLALNIRSMPALKGDYCLAPEMINSYPVWIHELRSLYIASDVNGVVVVTDYDRAMLHGNVCPAVLASTSPHGGLLPYEMKSWLRDDQGQWVEETGMSIRAVRALADIDCLKETVGMHGLPASPPFHHEIRPDVGPRDRDSPSEDEDEDDDESQDTEICDDDGGDTENVWRMPQRSVTLFMLPEPGQFLGQMRRVSSASF